MALVWCREGTRAGFIVHFICFLHIYYVVPRARIKIYKIACLGYLSSAVTAKFDI